MSLRQPTSRILRASALQPALSTAPRTRKQVRFATQDASSPDKSHPQGTSQSQPAQSGGSGSHKVKGAEPKILSENPPAEYDESVKQHNEEMDRRAEKAHEQIGNEDAEKDKVPPGYWKGGS
jgi:hypothetical protein